MTMPDGEQFVCCPDCEPHARSVARTDGSLDQCRAACDGCNGTYLETELEDIVLDDGTVLTCCRTCAAEAPGADADASNIDGDGGDEPGDSASTTESDRGSGDGTGADRNLCSQCREWTGAELFRITTIDERTERLCPDCKADADDRGIVADVEMRESKAREILGIDADATDADLREAFHEQVKRAHPDRKSGSQSAFKLVKDAYERLRDGG